MSPHKPNLLVVRFGWWAVWVATLGTVSLMDLRSPVGDVPVVINTKRSVLWYLTRIFLRSVGRVWTRPQIHGVENVPGSGAVILSPTHRSNMDFLMLLFVTNRKPFFMTRADLLRIPVLGRALSLLGCIGVEKSAQADRAVLRLAQEVLEAGQVLVMFPEGGLRVGDGVGPINDGVAFLAMRTGATVVPVGMSGTDVVLPIKSKVPRPHRVRVVIGRPIHSARATGRVSRTRVAAKSEELRSAMENAYTMASAWR